MFELQLSFSNNTYLTKRCPSLYDNLDSVYCVPTLPPTSTTYLSVQLSIADRY